MWKFFFCGVHGLPVFIPRQLAPHPIIEASTSLTSFFSECSLCHGIIMLEFKINPRNSSSCVGDKTLFFRLMTNSRASSSSTAGARCFLASSWFLAIINISSRYRIDLTPNFHNVETTGFINFVKTHGALHRPKRSTLNCHFWPFHSNLK